MSDKVTLIVFSGELDKAMAAFTLATTAASMGKEVTMFFTFWGLNAIKKNNAPVRGKGIIKKMMGFMNRGGVKRLTLSRFNMFGIGTKLMKKFMEESKVPSTEELLKMAIDMNVKLIACTMTMGVMGITKEDIIPEVKEFAGAATYLEKASKAQVNLFI